MALKRVAVPTQVVDAVVDATSKQEVGGGISLSYDEANFPVWTTPLAEDKIIYFPKSMVKTLDSGVEELNPYEFVVHSMKTKRGYEQFRCTTGLEGDYFEKELHYDGSCPFCDAVEHCWDLANVQIDLNCKKKGLVSTDTSDAVKAVKSEAYGARVIQAPEKKVVFPIVEFPATNITSDNNRKTLVPTMEKDANGNYVAKAYYIIMTEKKYRELVADVFENNGELDVLAGNIFKFKYSYEMKAGEKPTKALSGKALKWYLQKKDTSNEAVKALLTRAEEVAKDFTVENALANLKPCAFFMQEDLVAECDSIMQPTMAQLTALQAVVDANPEVQAQIAGDTSVTAGAQGIEATLASFGATPESATPTNVGTVAE